MSDEARMAAMIDSLNWWLSLRRNVNFWDWLEDTYSTEELKRLAFEATETSLIKPYDPMADEYFCNGKPLQEVITETSRRLYKRYHQDIWHICLGAGLNCEGVATGLASLAKLDLAPEVRGQVSFEEFMVRNAIKWAAKQILESGR
jgi:hypothetical protein